MNEPGYIFCSPTATHAPNIAGCIRGRCGICSEEVWVAPSSLRMMARNPKLQLMCMDCMPGIVATHGGGRLQMPTPEQIAELRENPQ